MAVADQDGVDRLGSDELEQAREDGIPGIEEQPKAGVLDQVAAARTPGGRPRPGAAQDRELHSVKIPPRALQSRR
jgi:hypothetical protein